MKKEYGILRFQIMIRILLLIGVVIAYQPVFGFNTIKGKIKRNTDFAGGSGTFSDPWLIATVEHLNNVRFYDEDHFLLLNNLDLDVEPYNADEGWEPIGTMDLPFRGVFDGDGYLIQNLYINRPEGRDNGLFGHMVGGTLANISLNNVYVNGRYKVGSLLGTAFSGTEILNCTAENVELHIRERFSGGLIGSADDINIYRCSAQGAIFKNAYFDWNFIGGLIGSITSSNTSTGSRIIECFAKVDIVSESHNSYGGLVGTMWYKAEVVNSYAIGSIIANGDRAGGLVGDASLGNGKKSVINSYAAVNIDTDPYAFDVRGFVGMPSGGPFEGNFYDIQVAGAVNSDWTASPKSTIEMKNLDTYLEAGWDFENVWSIDSNGIINDGYPFLQYNNPSTICYTPYALGIVSLIDTAVAFEWQIMDQSQTSDLAVGPAGFNPNTEGWLYPDLEGTTFSIDTLTSGTTYEVYVRNSCQNGEYSEWLGPLSFKTFTIFEVMGGGSYCFGDNLEVFLAESDSSVYYTLYHQGDSTGPAIQSTGDTVSWSVSETGIYSVLAYSEKGSVWMEGEANIIALALPDVYLILNFDTLCMDQIPFRLTGGYPGGGVYTGNGIVNNYIFTELLETGYHTVYYNFTDEYGCQNSSGASFFLDECLDIQEVADNQIAVDFYPNPVDELLTINLDNQTNYSSMILYSSDGRIVEELKVNKNHNKLTLVTHHLPTGIYLVKLYSSSKVEYFKFVKN